MVTPFQSSCLENSMNRGNFYSPCSCKRVGQDLLTKQSQQHGRELTCDAEAQLKLETAMCDAGSAEVGDRYVRCRHQHLGKLLIKIIRLNQTLPFCGSQGWLPNLQDLAQNEDHKAGRSQSRSKFFPSFSLFSCCGLFKLTI